MKSKSLKGAILGPNNIQFYGPFAWKISEETINKVYDTWCPRPTFQAGPDENILDPFRLV